MIVKPLTNRKWKGYSFEQLQDQRILNDARIAIQKTVIEEDVKNIKRVNFKDSSRRLFSALGYMDYIMLGITLVRKLRPVFKFFKRKK